MTDANTELAKINKMETKFKCRFLAFPDQLQSHVHVSATTCFARSMGEKRSQTKK